MNSKAKIADLKKAKWWRQAEKGILCLLCPRKCLIPEGKTGFCSVRANFANELFSLAYGHPAAIHIDPIEKKPLNEFLPRTTTFSIGCYGCNLDCAFCQNYHLSRGSYSTEDFSQFISPEKLVEDALAAGCQSVAFTYNEPVVWAEYMLDIAAAAKDRKLAAVMVSNGYIEPGPAKEIFPLIDAANIDMKGFSEKFYSKLTHSSLQPVLNAMKLFYEMGKHLEITNLVIPGENDSDEMIEAFLLWTKNELSPKIPLHFSAYHHSSYPSYASKHKAPR